MNDYNNDNDQTYFRFLNSVRESGAINMFGAAVPLAEMFELSMTEARAVLSRWMKQF